VRKKRRGAGYQEETLGKVIHRKRGEKILNNTKLEVGFTMNGSYRGWNREKVSTKEGGKTGKKG